MKRKNRVLTLTVCVDKTPRVFAVNTRTIGKWLRNECSCFDKEGFLLMYKYNCITPQVAGMLYSYAKRKKKIIGEN